MTTYRNTRRVWYRGAEEHPGELLEPGEEREYPHLKDDELELLTVMGVLVEVKTPVRKAAQAETDDSNQEAE